jgi:hypothetical protein
MSGPGTVVAAPGTVKEGMAGEVGGEAPRLDREGMEINVRLFFGSEICGKEIISN